VARAAREGNAEILAIAYMLCDEKIFAGVTRQIVLCFTGDISDVFGKEVMAGKIVPTYILGSLLPLRSTNSVN